MKKYIKSSSIWGDNEYIPNIEEQVDQIIDQVHDAVKAKFDKRYKGVQIDIDDAKWSPTRIVFQLTVYNRKGEVLRDTEFTFNAYSDYVDEQDYISHLNRKIYEYVEAIFNNQY